MLSGLGRVPVGGHLLRERPGAAVEAILAAAPATVAVRALPIAPLAGATAV